MARCSAPTAGGKPIPDSPGRSLLHLIAGPPAVHPDHPAPRPDHLTRLYRRPGGRGMDAYARPFLAAKP